MFKIPKLNKNLLKKNRVGLVILFGSQISGQVHPGSDFDIGVVFEDENFKKEKPLEVYGDLYEIFSNAFKTKNLDIVYLQETPLSLQFKAIYTGKVVYYSSLIFLANYKEKVMLKYFDFKPTEEYFQKVFLGKIPA